MWSRVGKAAGAGLLEQGDCLTGGHHSYANPAEIILMYTNSTSTGAAGRARGICVRQLL